MTRGNRSPRVSLGPFEAWAYHDYPMAPWRSPLYVGVRLGQFRLAASVLPASKLRPFSRGGSA